MEVGDIVGAEINAEAATRWCGLERVVEADRRRIFEQEVCSRLSDQHDGHAEEDSDRACHLVAEAERSMFLTLVTKVEYEDSSGMGSRGTADLQHQPDKMPMQPPHVGDRLSGCFTP